MATAAACKEESIDIRLHRGPLDDFNEQQMRNEMIKFIKDYKGEAIPPDASFEDNWLIVEAQLRSIIDAGLIPPDSVASAGLDNMSYTAVKMCADTLQSLLYGGEILEAIANLRGFRSLFSESTDDVLRHAFRGSPIEVLKNIYYGGHGILPEDRMLLADPFHYRENDDTSYMAGDHIENEFVKLEPDDDQKPDPWEKSESWGKPWFPPS